MPFLTITLPSTATKLGDLFGLSNEMNCFHDLIFPTANSANATIAKGATSSTSATAATAAPGTSQGLVCDYLGATSISGTTTDHVTLQYHPNGTSA